MAAMSAQALRARYATDAVTTASPARLLTMLYDRLVRDLVSAEEAIAARDRASANDNLQHAQAILLELQAALDPEVWEGGPGLSALYAFLVTELVRANVTQDGAKVTSCRALVEPLREAWQRAAVIALQEAVLP